ncbi:hypothetical protein [Candidatus Marithrix sp. Canyon 246]|nr:hypothetical protein [Candidatus Marithrix sp. Canyon 246]
MNVDFSRLLFYKKEKDAAKFIPIPMESGQSERLALQKTYTVNQDGHKYEYIVGSPLNPFHVYDHSRFKSLLAAIKNINITKLFNLQPLDAVIIDTNYHFCNIFHEQDGEYEEYKNGPLKDESITIWFMWVYRQLENLIRLKYDDADVIINTAAAIERNIKSNLTHKSPFMHVFGPATLVSSQTDKKTGIASALASKIYEAMTKNTDIHLDELRKIEQLSVGDSISFNDWLEKLDVAHIAAPKNSDPRHHFLDILINATETFAKDHDGKRPNNIIPLSVFHQGLRYYTDGCIFFIPYDMKETFLNLLKIIFKDANWLEKPSNEQLGIIGGDQFSNFYSENTKIQSTIEYEVMRKEQQELVQLFDKISEHKNGIDAVLVCNHDDMLFSSTPKQGSEYVDTDSFVINILF